MDNISDIVKDVIRSIHIPSEKTKEKLDQVWIRVLEKIERDHTKLIGLKENCLLVYVDSSACLYQMKMRKNEILNKIQNEFKDIKDIHFKIGKVL